MGLCGRLEIQSVMLVFSTSFVNCCPSLLLSGLPTPPCVNKYIVYTYTVCRGGGGGVGFWASDT
jgi:hypothetical protein